MITAQLATIPGREESVIKTINSLLPQVDAVVVMCNSPDMITSLRHCDRISNTVRNGKLTTLPRLNQKGDAEKFYGVEDLEGYVLTCDDDLIYPTDYATSMVEAINKFKNEVIISHHGRTFKPGKIGSYYSSFYRAEAFRCLGEVCGFHKVDSGGTGVMGWNADIVKITYDWFKSPNMADVWVAVNARKKGIQIYVAPHPEGWILQGFDGRGIWDDWSDGLKSDAMQTYLWNEF